MHEQLKYIQNMLGGTPAFLTGSAVAADHYDLDDAFNDIDIFTPTPIATASTIQQLLSAGSTLDEKYSRVWERWQTNGLSNFATHSMRMVLPSNMEVNVIFKKEHGHPLRSLAHVIESFDFGLLALGYDLRDPYTLRDYRPAMFPHLDPDGPLPLLPIRRRDWRCGFFSQYQGVRQASRYAKYVHYGYDMSEVAKDLIVGYHAGADYQFRLDTDDSLKLGAIYELLAEYITDDRLGELRELESTIRYSDALDQIMEALV